MEVILLLFIFIRGAALYIIRDKVDRCEQEKCTAKKPICGYEFPTSSNDTLTCHSPFEISKAIDTDLINLKPSTHGYFKVLGEIRHIYLLNGYRNWMEIEPISRFKWNTKEEGRLYYVESVAKKIIVRYYGKDRTFGTKHIHTSTEAPPMTTITTSIWPKNTTLFSETSRIPKVTTTTLFPQSTTQSSETLRFSRSTLLRPMISLQKSLKVQNYIITLVVVFICIFFIITLYFIKSRRQRVHIFNEIEMDEITEESIG